MSEIKSVFAANVRKYRKAAKLSQEKLAELAGLHRTYIGGIEQQRVNVSLRNVGRIANALDIDPALLFLPSEADSQESSLDLMSETPSHPRTCIVDESAKVEYALIAWHDDKTTIRRVRVEHEDLSVKVLCQLINQGFTGPDLATRYEKTCREIERFLQQAITDC